MCPCPLGPKEIDGLLTDHLITGHPLSVPAQEKCMFVGTMQNKSENSFVFIQKQTTATQTKIRVYLNAAVNYFYY